MRTLCRCECQQNASQSPNGAQFDNPGHRPGNRAPKKFEPCKGDTKDAITALIQAGFSHHLRSSRNQRGPELIHSLLADIDELFEDLLRSE